MRQGLERSRRVAVVAGPNDIRRDGSVPAEGEHESTAQLNGVGNLHARSIVQD
jgi:hypothetical protein